MGDYALGLRPRPNPPGYPSGTKHSRASALVRDRKPGHMCLATLSAFGLGQIHRVPIGAGFQYPFFYIKFGFFKNLATKNSVRKVAPIQSPRKRPKTRPNTTNQSPLQVKIQSDGCAGRSSKGGDGCKLVPRDSAIAKAGESARTISLRAFDSV